ncbi:PREDICTED: uncharacterized protein LOC107172152 [Diuraphis noxia]|uniref:uncharacterized protein LOC107172152 n=1 Tax=Diuraphis noxia TaxID=143948 RepID=UPI0007637A59|nr:PREDICTED: uncharacterized protein LOC107172152 [Diuraphis noxia]
MDWDYDGGYSTNYSENEIDLATVLMNLKEDYPSPDGSCNDHHEPSYYDSTTTGDDHQHHRHHQLLQWQYPSDEQPPHVLVYNSLDHPNTENCLLPSILGKCQVPGLDWTYLICRVFCDLSVHLQIYSQQHLPPCILWSVQVQHLDSIFSIINS